MGRQLKPVIGVYAMIFHALRDSMRDLLGPLADLRPAVDDGAAAYAVLRGIMPAGVTVPLHSHAERETLVIVEGRLEVWLDGVWREYGPGEMIDFRTNVRHALRNAGLEDVALVMVTTARMAAFFNEISAKPGQNEPSPERLEHFARVAARYGFWNGTLEDQAAIGITL